MSARKGVNLTLEHNARPAKEDIAAGIGRLGLPEYTLSNGVHSDALRAAYQEGTLLHVSPVGGPLISSGAGADP